MKATFLRLACLVALLGVNGQAHAQPGTLETTFNSLLNVGAQVYAVALQTNGQIIIGGSFTSIAGTSIKNVARLNQNGSLDLTFNPMTAADYGFISALVVQPDGKILIGGSFASTTGAAPSNLARLNTNGTADASFDINLSIDNAVNALCLQSDGGILFGGAFEFVDGFFRRSVARLYPNGTLDSSFDACVASGSGSGATALTLVSADQILMSGAFAFSTGSYRDGVARLNPNGDLDATYAPIPGVDPSGSAYSLISRSDGKALLGGYFSTFHSVANRGLVQLTTSGVPDPPFVVGTGINVAGTNFAMSLQPDGKVIVGGDFTNYNATTRFRVARINLNGSLDPIFDPGLGANDAISAFAIQGDGKILVVGKFTTFNGVSRIGIARLKGDPKSRLDSPTRLGNGQFQFLFSGDDQIPYAIQASSNLVNWISITNFTSSTNAVTILDTNAASYSRRFYRAVYPP